MDAFFNEKREALSTLIKCTYFKLKFNDVLSVRGYKKLT